MRWIAILIILAIVGFLGAYVWMDQSRLSLAETGERLPHQVDVVVPELSVVAQSGREVFAANCQLCHGANAAGGPGGPPLVHIIYEPNHHGDMSFLNAVRLGVRQHHWSFGNMPPVAGVTMDQTVAIIAYIRELQRANGIQ